jgi:hypothetical protein
MGMFSAKCPKCWDPYPCSCDGGYGQQQDRLIRQVQDENIKLKERIEKLESDKQLTSRYP